MRQRSGSQPWMMRLGLAWGSVLHGLVGVALQGAAPPPCVPPPTRQTAAWVGIAGVAFAELLTEVVAEEGLLRQTIMDEEVWWGDARLWGGCCPAAVFATGRSAIWHGRCYIGGTAGCPCCL